MLLQWKEEESTIASDAKQYKSKPLSLLLLSKSRCRRREISTLHSRFDRRPSHFSLPYLLRTAKIFLSAFHIFSLLPLFGAAADSERKVSFKQILLPLLAPPSLGGRKGKREAELNFKNLLFSSQFVEAAAGFLFSNDVAVSKTSNWEGLKNDFNKKLFRISLLS